MLASILLTLGLSIFPTFSNAAAVSKRADSCGVHGYDKSNAYSYDGSGASATLAACGAKCQVDTQCKSFGFGGTECLLYALTVTENVNVDANSGYSFYDVGCVTTATTSSTTSSTTLTTSTVSTTASPSATPTEICGQAGYDRGDLPSYNYDNSGANGNLAACTARCLADFKCGGFAFSSTECLLYWAPFTYPYGPTPPNFFPKADSPYLFYDRSCVQPPSTTTTSPTSSTSTTPTPTQTFCLQVTGTGPPGKGYYAYTAPSVNGNGLFFTSDPATTRVPQLVYIAAPFGAPFLFDLSGNKLEFSYRFGDPAPPLEQPLRWLGQLGRADQADNQILQCSAGLNSQLECVAGGNGFIWRNWAVTDASFATEQELYFQTSTGAKGQIGLTIVDQALCPPTAVLNP